MIENIVEKEIYDIEEELGNEEVISDMSFDPNQIRVKTLTLNIGHVMDMIENGEIVLDTERTNLWDSVKKSRLIESLLLRLPTPNFYFDEQDNYNWRVIDGLQRISAFRSFIKDKMPLHGLEFLKEFEKKTYEELPRELQRRIVWSELTVFILEKGTPNAVKYVLFNRINQNSLLPKQQLRHDAKKI